MFGIHAVQTLLKTAAHRVHYVHILKGREDQRQQKLIALAERNELALHRVPRTELDALVDGEQHQGVAAYCQTTALQDEHYLKQWLEDNQAKDEVQTPFFLVLDGVTDPHNLGACLRSADAAGVQLVIVPKDNAVGLTPVVQKVACGATETVPLVAVTNLSRTLKQLQDAGLWIIGAAGEAEQSIYTVDLKGPIAVVMGAEGTGLRRLTREHCDVLMKLPMAGSVSSLNVSVAAGICLFEAVRQRQ